MMAFLLVLLMTEDPSFQLAIVRQLDPVPETENAFLEQPRDIAIDRQGRWLILDLTARRIFAWDRNGTFLRTAGQEGQGPGEFNFRASMGGSQGFIDAVDGWVLVYDGGNRVIHIFDENLVFRKLIRFNLPQGRVLSFRALAEKRFLIFNSSFTAEEPFRQIALYGEQPISEKVIVKASIQTWRYANRNRSGVIRHIYSPSLFMHYDRTTNQMIIGNSARAEFSVYDSRGDLSNTVSFAVPRIPVTEADIREYDEQEWLKRNRFFTAEYPENKAYYDKIYPVGDRGYLIFNESPVTRNCQGYWIDRQGGVVGRFTFEPGEGGRLLAANGRIIAVTTNEEGMFSIAELKPELP